MRPKAPPIVGTWVNSEPIRPDHLEHRVTVLLFWAISCESSRIRLAQLEKLRERFGARVAVVAIHSPRLQYETDAVVVSREIAKARIEVPIIHDQSLETWGNFGIEGRPTTVVIDHRGRVIGAVAGSDSLAIIDEAVELADRVASQARQRAGNDLVPLPPLPSADQADPFDVLGVTPTAPDELLWPSDVAALPANNVVVLDTGNDRLVRLAMNHAMTSARVVGEISSLAGATKICATHDRAVAISLPERGQVRAVDLDSGRSRILAEGLSRPRGLVTDRDGSLVVAAPGSEQIVRVPRHGATGVIAGSGLTGLRDGPARTAELAQPVDLVRVEAGIMFTEAGSNTLRMLTDKGVVFTITSHNRSTDRRDFVGANEPGLVDGPARTARFQHPMGLTSLPDGSIVVADTGNDRLRVLSERRVRTIPLVGLQKPEGITTLSPGRVLVADTGNNRLVVVDMTTSTSWTLAIERQTTPHQSTVYA